MHKHPFIKKTAFADALLSKFACTAHFQILNRFIKFGAPNGKFFSSTNINLKK
jgi:hypothetical protein